MSSQQEEWRYAASIQRMLDRKPESAFNVVGLMCEQYFGLPVEQAAKLAAEFCFFAMTRNYPWTLNSAAIFARNAAREYWRRRSRTPVVIDSSRAQSVSVIATLAALQPRYAERLRDAVGRRSDAVSAERKRMSPNVSKMIAPELWQAGEVHDILIDRQ